MKDFNFIKVFFLLGKSLYYGIEIQQKKVLWNGKEFFFKSLFSKKYIHTYLGGGGNFLLATKITFFGKFGNGVGGFSR